MSILGAEIKIPRVESVRVTEDTLGVDLSDGRTISVPLAWFPRLVYATPEDVVKSTAEFPVNVPQYLLFSTPPFAISGSYPMPFHFP